MLVALVVSIPPTIAALAAWRGGRGCPAKLDRLEAMLDDVLDWQIEHAREHRVHIRRVGGGHQ